MSGIVGHMQRALVAVFLLLSACADPASGTPATAFPASASVSPPVQSQSAAPSASSAPAASPFAISKEDFKRIAEDISEPESEFFSDNFISNETSYLQVAPALAKVKPGGAYLGVGPEQNFTYIALTKPDFAYVIDIRRDNLVLMLLYKALFEAATSRAHFLALLTGRPYRGDDGLAADATLEQIFAHAERDKADDKSFSAGHDALAKRIAAYGIALSDKDKRSLATAHRAFFADGLDIRFKLKEESFRRYPSLRELLGAKDAAGAQTGFLASEASFRLLQTMQRENRIVPLVGDFAGKKAMPALAEHMKKAHQTLRSFYVSNVEQYLLVDGKWHTWQKNVAAFPSDADSIFIRCYLDQGKAHPKQMQGHRTATTLHSIAAFNARKQAYGSFLALASDGVLGN
jgi:hypothetical protein